MSHRSFRNEIVTFVARSLPPKYRKIKATLTPKPTSEYARLLRAKAELVTKLDFKFRKAITLRRPSLPRGTSEPSSINGFRGNTFIFAKEAHVSGDEYHVNQAGAVGPGSSAQNFQQVWNHWQSGAGNVDLNELAKNLEDLRQEMKKKAQSPEEDAAVGEVAGAQVAANAGDGSKVLEKLAKAGKWALSIAETIGAALAAEALKKAIGL